jgi:hypothetical protein
MSSNIEKYLLGNSKPYTNNKTSSFSPFAFFKSGEKIQNNGSTATTNGLIGGIGGSGIKRIIAYLLAIVVVIFVILLFVHFFIKPVFQLRPGAPGVIPVPGGDDGKLFWNKTSAGRILDKDLPISQQYYGYTINLDIFIQNPLQFSNSPRILFSRGAEFKQQPSGDTLLSVLSNYNIVVALLPDVNDIIVSVLNKDNNMENVIIQNAAVQEPFRLGMVVMENALEVYLNGHLVKTKTFTSPLKDVKGDIYPATGAEANIAKLRNLKIWPRLLTTSEIRYASPSLSSAKDFNASPMATSSMCSVGNKINDLSSTMNNIPAASDMPSLKFI